MDRHEIKKQIQSFFRDEKSGEGRKFVDFWYHFFDDRPEELEDMTAREKEELRREIYHEIRRRTDLTPEPIPRIGSARRRSKPLWPYKLAAGFAVILLIAVPLLLLTNQQTVPVPEPVAYTTSSNPAGQASEVRLTDGTVVWLSANSTLEYPERFEGGQREVILRGEAFFDVAPDPETPFIVKSGDLRTRVLGTSFNIRAFDGGEDIEITVVTGRVSVEQTAHDKSAVTDQQSTPALLYPEQQLVYNNQTGITETREVNSRVFTSWKDGLLMFENHTFGEIATRLERWYGVEIHFANEELKQIRFRVLFENTSLEYALNMLQAIRDFEFEIEDKNVWISARKS